MTDYLKILYWTQITDDNVSFRPVFFFHPRVEILAFLEDRRYRNIPVAIRDTGGLYDGFHLATMDVATGLGACPADLDPTRPVYAATLASVSFTIYPATPGEFAVLMDGGGPPPTKEENVREAFEPAVETPVPAEPEETENACLARTSRKYWVFVVVFMLVLILLILLCFLPKK